MPLGPLEIELLSLLATLINVMCGCEHIYMHVCFGVRVRRGRGLRDFRIIALH